MELLDEIKSSQKVLPIKKYSKQTKNLRLALDIGTNSIGWALYKLSQDKKPVSIVGTGVRIFSSGRKDKDWTTLNASRRQKRLQRRQRDRYLQRRAYLLHLLKKQGLFPEDLFSAKKLEKLNPYELRAKALDEELELHHFGRALFHINQKRGFKSNRKSVEAKEEGLISQSVKASQELMQEYKSRTYGEFLWKRFQTMEESRKNPGSQEKNWVLARRAVGAGAKDNYAVYAQRAMLEEEFNKLWESQSRFYEKLKDEKLKNLFFKAIFFQRPLKKPIVGICSLTHEKRISKALPSFQKFRILKELNNLAYRDSKGQFHPIVQLEEGIKFRDKIIKDLFLKKAKVTFSQLERAFKNFFPHINDFLQFNLDSFNRKDLEGDKTSHVLKTIIPDWLEWNLETQDRFIELLEGESEEGDFMKEDEEVKKDLLKFSEDHQLNLKKDAIDKCLDNMKLPDGHGQYSKKAIQKILPFLEKGEKEHEAIPLASLGHHSDRQDRGALADELPKYQDILSDHCVEMSLKKPNFRDQKDPKTFRILNPTVHIAFNQLRLVVNDIIRVYGKPAQIVVETARDLPHGVITKRKLEKRNKDNKAQNDEAVRFIEKFEQKNNRANRQRYQLWKEQKKTCLYSGETISLSQLWTAELEVDHILPWSRTLDDSLSNKVLVYKSSNQNKSDKSPFEFFSSNQNRWEGILQRVKDLPKNKQWRFNSDAMDKFKEEGGFLERQLNDTRYISKYATQYLKRICEKVWTARGQSTSILRYSLQFEKKNRDDYRNHAKDALAIGLMDRSFVQHISRIAKRIEGQDKGRLENIGKAIKEDVLPWPDFKDDAKKSIDKIVVSHRKRTKKQGQLHNETAYGVSENGQDFSQAVDVIHYVDILSLSNENKLNKIVSDKIKRDFLDELGKNNKISKEFIQDYHNTTGVRRVRLKEKETVIPIKNKSKKTYKAFKGDSNYAMELFENSKGKWDARVISRFDANQKFIKPLSKKARLMMGDMLFFENKYWRLVRISKGNRMTFSEHFEANVDARNRGHHENLYKYTYKSPGSLQKIQPKRVDISPCGVLKLTPFDLTVRKKTMKRI